MLANIGVKLRNGFTRFTSPPYLSTVSKYQISLCCAASEVAEFPAKGSSCASAEVPSDNWRFGFAPCCNRHSNPSLFWLRSAHITGIMLSLPRTFTSTPSDSSLVTSAVRPLAAASANAAACPSEKYSAASIAFRGLQPRLKPASRIPHPRTIKLSAQRHCVWMFNGVCVAMTIPRRSH